MIRPLSLLLLAALATACLQPRGGHSDGCEGSQGLGKAPVSLTISKANGIPVTSSDMTVFRTAGAALSVTLELSTQTWAGWCESSYSGPLTYELGGLPSGISYAFDPVTLPAAGSFQPRASVLTLGLPASIPDGAIALSFTAQEGRVSASPFRIVVRTGP